MGDGLIPLAPPRPRQLTWAGRVAAGVAVVVLLLASRWRPLPPDPWGIQAGRSVSGPLLLGLAVLVALGLAASWRWMGAAATTVAVAAAGVGAFAVVQYRPVLAVGLILGVLLPAVLLWTAWQATRARRAIGVLAAVTGVLVATAWVGTSAALDARYGPSHPESHTEALAVDQVRWLWTGALTSDGITVVVGVDGAGRRVAVRVRPAAGGPVVLSETVRSDVDGVARVAVEGLAPDTAQRFEVLVDGQVDTGRGRGSFRTSADGPLSFRVAFASCARSGSNGAVYDAIRAKDPLLYLILGDLHYANISTDEPWRFRSAFERALTAPAPAALYREVPIAYVWDDHDFGDDGADSSSPSRPAALATYRQMVPNRASTAPEAPIGQAFSVGRVRFVMTDGRSARTGSSLLGPEQERWLIDEITTASQTHAAVVWANPSPWIGAPDPTQDTWAGFPDERRRIATALADAQVDNLVMISGDAHMVAFDDGSHTGETAEGGRGFPLLQAAALDRPGSIKGGPYSGGTFPGGGQFGTLDVRDDGTTVTVEMAGWTWAGERLVDETVTLPQT